MDSLSNRLSAKTDLACRLIQARGFLMSDHSFDDLLQALQSALVNAQETLRKKHEEAIRRMYESSETSGSRSPVFAFGIPQNGRDGYEMLSLPASSLRAHRCQQISMLTLEFECELKESRLVGAAQVYSLSIKARKKRRWWRKKRWRMQILFRGTDHPSGEVMIDGKLLMEIPLHGGAINSRPLIAAKQPLFYKMLNLLRNMWRQQEFIMTAEQSRRIREILGQQNSATQSDG